MAGKALTPGSQKVSCEIVLSLPRLDKIREVDPQSNTMTCEAGVVLAAADAGLTACPVKGFGNARSELC